MARCVRCGIWSAFVAGLLLAGSASTSARPQAQPPLVVVQGGEVRATVPVQRFAVDGNRAAFVLCAHVIGVWRTGTSNVTRLGPPGVRTCGIPPNPIGPFAIYNIAIGGARVAYLTDAGGIQVRYNLWAINLGQPAQVREIAGDVRCCRGDPFAQERFGWVIADSTLTVFSNFLVCGEGGTPPCSPPSSRSISAQTIWRLRASGFSGTCPGRTGPCSLVVAANAALTPLSVSNKRVALRRATGVIEVRNAAGQLLRVFPGLAGAGRAAEFDWKNRLVVLRNGAVLQFSLQTGQLLRTRPLPALPAAPGLCGIIPCPPQPLTLEDVARGLVVYRTSSRLRLLRLRDGADVDLAEGTEAHFGSGGLFYAYTAQGARPGRIKYVPFGSLPLTP